MFPLCREANKRLSAIIAEVPALAVGVGVADLDCLRVLAYLAMWAEDFRHDRSLVLCVFTLLLRGFRWTRL